MLGSHPPEENRAECVLALKMPESKLQWKVIESLLIKMELFSENQEMLDIAQPELVGHLEVEQSVVEVDGGGQR
ncbi:hypothetical protein [Nostoc sp.]|uniref:hypothetical protein n=1 Tax=Nostoc sp. TaxID=1180 RepID=UPI002FF533D6